MVKCIIGLGNPGKKYDKTRHNIGFEVIDELLKRHHLSLDQQKYRGKYTSDRIHGEKVLLVQPQTFMNRSGECVQPLLNYYKIPIESILVVYDDLDLPVGKIRLRQKGGHGGHNGLRSIINLLNTKDFKRLRLGIGRPTTPIATVDYVLEKFSKDQQLDVQKSIEKAADACERWLTEKDFVQVMNEFN